MRLDSARNRPPGSRLLAILLAGLASLVTIPGEESLAEGPWDPGAGPVHDTKYAHVFVYRTRRWGDLIAPVVYCDGRKIAKLSDGCFVMLKLDPGAHHLQSNHKKYVLDVDVESGREYFIEMKFVQTASGNYKGVLEQETRVHAMNYVPWLKPLEGDNIKDKELVAVGSEAPE